MNNTAKKINTDEKLIWEIYEPSRTLGFSVELEKAFGKKQTSELINQLADAKLLRSLIVMRGEDNRYLKLTEQSFSFLLNEKFGKKFSEIEPMALVDWLHQSGLPEQLLNELAHAAFHQRNEKDFFIYSDLILNNRDKFNNQAVIARAIHDLGSWYGVQNQAEKAILYNKEALTLANQIGEKVVAAKAKFALSYNKDNLKPKDQAEDFILLAETLEKAGVVSDAIRAKIEAAKALAKLAERQDKKLKIVTLAGAKDLALEALKNAKDSNYPNAEIQAREVLSLAYALIEENRKERSYKKGAQDLRGKYQYKTIK